ncbi:oxidoreductase [Penicillium maclennaniae]|uniref:oxidoreductase n=1 Tax=Penicillium maclennaniae TaxID=1343394 RepID=UPI0025406A40|nr:oxidoreductase [Penicillium maclennaniae]KAJ5681670.1 oxidoreductase [Penicillium maclennaniae]
MPDLAANSSFYEMGKPRNGENIFISATSGTTGSVGSDRKLDYLLNALRFDSGFNYKKEKLFNALAALLRKA